MDLSVIDYLHLFNPFYYYYSNNRDPKNPKTPYYDRVYLCIEKDNSNTNTNAPIKGFHCFQCNSFEEADAEYHKKFTKLDGRSTMIPICKYVPFYFDPYIVNNKLKNKFWLGKHTFLKRSNKNKE